MHHNHDRLGDQYPLQKNEIVHIPVQLTDLPPSTNLTRNEIEAFIRDNLGKQAYIVTTRIPNLEVPYTVQLNVHHAVMAKKGLISQVHLL